MSVAGAVRDAVSWYVHRPVLLVVAALARRIEDAVSWYVVRPALELTRRAAEMLLRVARAMHRP